MVFEVRAAESEVVPWKSNSRGNKGDRTLTQISTRVPAFIADLELPNLGQLEVLVQEALAAVARFDVSCERLGIGVSPLLVRTESVASSRFEELNSSEMNFLRATVGQKLSEDAVAMAAGLESLRFVVENTRPHCDLNLDLLLSAHEILMRRDSLDSEFAGVVRTFQNWIEGNAKSPLGATYIPPVPERVRPLLDDLFKFVNRTDVNPLVLAAIGHAQFEAIHPFADGNGRIGRALITAILRKFDLTRIAVVPLAAALTADRTSYIAGISSYLEGDATQIITVISQGLKVASETGRGVVTQLADLPNSWLQALGPRADSSIERVLNLLIATNTITAPEVSQSLGVTLKTALTAIDALEQNNILQEITGRKRDRHWVAPEVIDLLGYYADDTAERMRQLKKS